MKTSFAKTAAFAAILSCPIALLSLGLVFGAFNWDFDVAFNPAKAIAYQPDPSKMLHYGWLLDILGYYLLWVPIAIYLGQGLSTKSTLYSQLFTFCGKGYILCGGLGAAILLAQGDKVRAQLALEKALRLEPNNVDAKGLLDALNK